MIKIKTTINSSLIQVFTGIPAKYFNKLTRQLQPIWENYEKQRLSGKPRIRKIGGGTKYKLKTLEVKLFFYLLYLRHYVNQRVIAALCQLDQSGVCRLFKRLEKVIARAADPQLKIFLSNLNDKRIKEGLSFDELKIIYPEIEKIITDVTEVRCNRPKDKTQRKDKTSGKKKQYTLKKQVSVTKSNRIIAISKAYPGKVHDFNIEKQEQMISSMPRESYQPVDLGYLGINKLCPDHYVVAPPKKAKNREMSPLLKELKKAHSRKRIPVEHVFGSLKRFNILKHYRGPDSRFDNVFDNIAAINNLCLGLT